MRDTPDFDIPDSAPKAAVSIRYDPDGFKPDQVNPLDDIKKLNDLNHNLVAAFRRITADDSLDNVTPEIPSVDPPPGDGGGVGGGGGSGPGPVDEPEEPESAGFTDADADGVHAASIDALFEAGLTVGCAREPLRFCGDRPVTRAQMATLLVRALDLPPARSAGFTDVDADGSVILTWDAPDDDSVSGYLILRRRPYEGGKDAAGVRGGHGKRSDHLHRHRRDGGNAARVPGEGRQRSWRGRAVQLRQRQPVGLDRMR